MEKLSDATEVCRLCLADLTQADEYYSIDEAVQKVLEDLTGISIDLDDSSLPLSMCTSCFLALSQFGGLRDSWIDNQQKILNLQQSGEEEDLSSIVKEEEYILESDDCEMEDSQSGNYDYSVEYVDEFELVETTEEVNDPLIERKQTKKIQKQSSKSKSKKTDAASKEKGKSIYQKLLKKCDECGKMIEKNRMEGHMNKHRNVKPFICEMQECNKSFYCKLLLRLHQTSIHTGKNATCEICIKVFPSERSLYSHMLRHKNEDRYNCDCCPRKFNNANSLKRHLAIHSGIREFKCDYCTSSFYRKFNLDVHVKTVHEKDKSYSCSYCPKTFGYARLLRNHTERSHPGGALGSEC